ncbi:DEAD/DEAH box helicase [uncultured Fluviicola sp.]|uniref:DEAD/DEAH box helicase n=1 Tax=uncultured Fluviicola sp. TaxID=463303 RepID=UPI0025CB9BDC|nr:DEAD/DEAH box helicase [uncultured Fluviicola sp.]
MTFHDLNIKKPILTALDELEYTTPTTIQSAGFSVMMSGKDVIGLAQTGTGKTLAYLLPMLSLWKFSKEPHPQILIIVPTRELVVQVVREVEKLTPYMNVVVGGVYGGANINTQAAMVLQGLDVLVGTPGRIFDLTANGSLQLKHVKKVVIDEVDETLNLGFRPQLMRIFELLPEKRQNLLFSATLSEEVEAFLDSYFDNPVRVEAARAGTPLEKIRQEAIAVPNFTSKVNLLKHLLEENKEMTKVLVFVSSRVLAEKLFDELEPIFNVELGIIHSQKAQNFRFNTVNHFENGIYRVLIATDLIARGIDVTDVTHVFNFDIPDNVENYIHRIGRTGRQDKEGHAISFVTEKDKEFFGQIEKFMNKQVAISEFPDEVELSELILEFEKPQVAMKNTLVKTPSKDEAGPAFHEKKAKNKKVNVRYNHKKAMQEKYGKPKKRGTKKK